MSKQPKTIRQKKFFGNVMTAKSFAEAARLAGYSPKSARVSAYKNISKYNDFFINLFQESGIDLDILSQSLKRGLESEDEAMRFKYLKLALELVEKVLKQEDSEIVRLPRLDSDEEGVEEQNAYMEDLERLEKRIYR